MNRWALSLYSAAGSALLAYWLDPAAGRARRARAASRLASAAGSSRRFARMAALDARNRSAGLAAQARSRWNSEAAPADDAVLVARVRSQLGRVVSHPHALEIGAQGGCVTLAGPVLEREADAALACARRVPGVERVEDRLQRHAQAGRLPALQGGVERTGPAAWEFSQRSWSPAARVLAGAAGLALMGGALLRRRGPMGKLLGVAGASLLARSTTNVDAAHLLRAGDRSCRVEKSILIHAPVERVFAFWRDVQNFPRFMSHVREVSGDTAGTTHWRVDGVPGRPLEWTARCTAIRDEELIAWETLPGSPLCHSGSVRFERCDADTTRVHVRLDYQPPGGALGDGLGRLLGRDPKHQLDDDLMRAKAFLENGRPAHDAAMHHRPTPPAARPTL